MISRRAIREAAIAHALHAEGCRGGLVWNDEVSASEYLVAHPSGQVVVEVAVGDTGDLEGLSQRQQEAGVEHQHPLQLQHLISHLLVVETE